MSACLLGEPVRFDGTAAMSTPRTPVELRGGDGAAVLSGRARAVTEHGEDLTPVFIAGAKAATEVCRLRGVALAVTKDRSPSCGRSTIHDGSFSGRLVSGEGIVAAALRQAGIRVFSEAQLPEAEAYLREIEVRLPRWPPDA